MFKDVILQCYTVIYFNEVVTGIFFKLKLTALKMVSLNFNHYINTQDDL